MARRAKKIKGGGAADKSGRDTTLAAVLLSDGVFERVEEWTSLDEIIESEEHVVEPEDAGCVIVPIEDYERMMAAVAKSATPRDADGFLDPSKHQRALRGWTVLRPGELKKLIAEARLNTLSAMLRYIWFNADNLWDAMRALLAITHKWKPEFVKGMSGAQIAKMLGVGRQAFNKQSIKLVQDFLERWGVSPMQTPGSKGVIHQEKKRAQMMGRKHRAADYVAEEKAPEAKYSRKQLDKMHQDHERKRLATLAGVKAEDIDLEKSKL